MSSQDLKREAEDTTRRPHYEEPRAPRATKFVVAALLLVLIVGGVITLMSRTQSHKALAAETERLAVPNVSVITPKKEAPDEQLVLPGTLQAYTESPIFARTNGYLLRWYKDIGSRVNKGELLADIDTPEIDQELLQARAAREQTLAQLKLARVSAERWENLRKTDSVSQQEADQQTSGYAQSQANLAAADANVKRLEKLEQFKHVYAPFAGVITRRNIDIGALINAGNTGSTGEMFRIALVDPLRVYVSVPQFYAPAIKRGMKATVTLQEFPGQQFEGTVVRTADSIDLTTRTLLTEVDVPNKKGTLLPGSYGQVSFKVQQDVNKLQIPVNAMLFRSEGLRVAVVDGNGKVHLQAIQVGRDYGTSIEVVGGLQASDRLILNPADSLEEGQQVNIAQPGQGGNGPNNGSGSEEKKS